MCLYPVYMSREDVVEGFLAALVVGFGVMLTDLLTYLLRITPGLTLVTGCLLLVRRQRDPLLSIVVLILGFILIRDAMTPLGPWRLGTVGGVVPRLRFTTDTTLLAALGVATLVLTAVVLASDQRLRALIPRQRPDLAAIGLGIAGAAAAAVPLSPSPAIGHRRPVVAPSRCPQCR